MTKDSLQNAKDSLHETEDSFKNTEGLEDSCTFRGIQTSTRDLSPEMIQYRWAILRRAEKAYGLGVWLLAADLPMDLWTDMNLSPKNILWSRFGKSGPKIDRAEITAQIISKVD